jgi:DNA-binding PadR family transcriptional regulator
MMSNPLSNLKSAMNKTIFKEASFSEERRNAVREAIRGKQNGNQLHSWKENTILAVLESLLHEPKQGYDISTNLFQKQELSFQGNEGQLYTLLHLLENKGILISKWIEEKKYYSLSSKGKKFLASYKEESPKHLVTLKSLLEEASL